MIRAEDWRRGSGELTSSAGAEAQTGPRFLRSPAGSYRELRGNSRDKGAMVPGWPLGYGRKASREGSVESEQKERHLPYSSSHIY